MNIIVLAGGRGTRLWPLSTGERPKHLLPLFGNLSLLQMTWERALEIAAPEDIVTVTNPVQCPLVTGQASPFPPELAANIICEPEGRSTLPSIILGLLYIAGRSPARASRTTLVLPSDHLVRTGRQFARDAALADKAAGEGFLVTFGIRPDRPETGYGYLETAEKKKGYWTCARFIEKPGPARARRFMRSGRHLWNSGIFAFRPADFRAQLAGQDPETASLMDLGYNRFRSAFSSCRAISIDYGLMEKAGRVAVVPARFSWTDLGSWDALYRCGDPDEAGNVTRGEVMAEKSAGCLVVSSGPTVVAGHVRDLVIIATPEAVLVLKRGRGQAVRGLGTRAAARGKVKPPGVKRAG